VGLLATVTGVSLLRKVLRFLLVVVLVVAAYFAVTAVQVWLTGRRHEAHPAGAIVVMGAAQYDGVPSPDLAARLDEAYLLWKLGYAQVVMVTGSKEPGDQFTESEAGARYLEAKGVPAADIEQVGGTDSWQNLSLAAPPLLAQGRGSVLLVTDPFHEDRSLAIASAVGLRASPTPTRTSPITGMAAVPYYAKETVGVGLGRIIGYNHLSELHASLG